MDAERDNQWQVLHRRIVQGEVLSSAEQSVYDAGCRELDAEECLDGNLVRLRELRVGIWEATAEQRQLREREAELDARMLDLKTRLERRSSQLLSEVN
jgi:hypothetical protein